MKEKVPAEERVREIRQKTRKKYSAEEKVRVVLEGLRGEESIAELCRRYRQARQPLPQLRFRRTRRVVLTHQGPDRRTAVSGSAASHRRSDASPPYRFRFLTGSCRSAGPHTVCR